jgi:hypothetical protein
MNEKINPYKNPCNELFAKLNIIYGLLFHHVNYLNNYRKSIKQQLDQNGLDVSNFAAGSALVIRDLTEWPEDNWARYYPTGSFTSQGESYLTKVDDLIYREAAWTIAQAYEAFETYLKDVVALYLLDNPDIVDEDLIKKNSKFRRKSDLHPSNFEYWEKFVRLSFRSGTKTLEYLRREVPDLSKGEKQNNRDVDMAVWFETVSEVRHATTHTNLLINSRKMSNFSNIHDNLMKEYFPGDITVKGYELRILRKSAETALIFFEEYAFLVFKCLSIKKGYNWHSLLNKNKKSG